MGTINIVKTIKTVHPSCMVMVKIGTFYDVYSKDAYIISYLLKYKIKEKDNIPTCSFPVSSLSKVENILEKNKINYLVVDKRLNYNFGDTYQIYHTKHQYLYFKRTLKFNCANSKIEI